MSNTGTLAKEKKFFLRSFLSLMLQMFTDFHFFFKTSLLSHTEIKHTIRCQVGTKKTTLSFIYIYKG
jgi:hypothetical protein